MGGGIFPLQHVVSHEFVELYIHACIMELLSSSMIILFLKYLTKCI